MSTELRHRLFAALATGSAEELAAALAVVQLISLNPKNRKPSVVPCRSRRASVENENKNPIA
jgi:hypothetical protein